MIALSTLTFDTAGHLVLPDAEPEDAYQGQRRGSVTATLDGGSYLYDTGFSVSDQTLTVTLRNPSEATLQHLRYLVAYYAELILSCRLGVFRARLSFANKDATCTLSLRLLSRLDG